MIGWSIEILIVAKDDCTRTRFHRRRKVSGKLDVSASHTCVYFYGFHTLFMDFIFSNKINDSNAWQTNTRDNDWRDAFLLSMFVADYRQCHIRTEREHRMCEPLMERASYSLSEHELKRRWTTDKSDISIVSFLLIWRAHLLS